MAGLDFSEEDIAAAFRRCDMDRNGFIGLSDLRTTLAALREHATEEEMDEMLSMLDQDGDGQVEFAEFRRLVQTDIMGVTQTQAELLRAAGAAPQPMQPGQAPAQQQEQKQPQPEEKSQPAAASAASSSLRPAAPTPATDVQVDRHSLQNALALLGNTNAALKLSLPKLQALFQGQRGAAAALLDANELVEAMSAKGDEAAAAAVRAMCAFFSDDRTGKARLRSVIIALAAALDKADRTEKIKFAFSVCDPQKRGFISRADLTDILRATLLTLPEQEIQRRAALLIAASLSSDARIEFSQFIAVAKKFPNVIFPTLRAGASPSSSPATAPRR
jgi:Ca2+-binding EF-hand superfamily protein